MPILPPDVIARELTKLSQLPVEGLRVEWSRIFNAEPPRNARREYLLRVIAHRFQCEAHGELSPKTLRSLLKLSESSKTPNTSAASPSTRTLKPGARILREWKGRVHEVEVVEAGYRYETHIYKSLSVIARQITGTRWSGPVFFGLKQAQPEVARGA